MRTVTEAVGEAFDAQLAQMEATMAGDGDKLVVGTVIPLGPWQALMQTEPAVTLHLDGLDAASRTWDGKRHGPPAVAAPEAQAHAPTPEEWGEAMRTARETHPGASRISLEWLARDFFAAVWGVGPSPDPVSLRIPRRAARHPRG